MIGAAPFSTWVAEIRPTSVVVNGCEDTGTVFIENGRFHGEAIVGAITGGVLTARG